MKKLNRFYLIFIVGIVALISYALLPETKKSQQCHNISLENTIYNFIDAMKEARDDSKKRYEFCNYDEQCEIWVLPKITIEQFADAIDSFIQNNDDYTIADHTDYGRIKLMNFEFSPFLRGLNGELLKNLSSFSIADFKDKSLVYHFSSYLQLYNQEDFSLKEDKLFITHSELAGVLAGYRYRLGEKIPFHKDINRIYTLDQCGRLLGFYFYDLVQ